jgi:alpha-beta hydrolase superfamily lysophospholipase
LSFPLHTADAAAVLAATGIGRASIVTASRGLNAALLLIANDPERFDRPTPTLVVHGAEDEPVPVELAERIVAAMPNARLEVIPGGGHRPDIRSPELVNPLLLEFLLVG